MLVMEDSNVNSKAVELKVVDDEVEETELRLGLPGARGRRAAETPRHGTNNTIYASKRKRDAEITCSRKLDLKLKLLEPKDRSATAMGYLIKKQRHLLLNTNHSLIQFPVQPSAGGGVNKTAHSLVELVRSRADEVTEAAAAVSRAAAAAAIVNVGMQGTPYTRKMDLNMYKNYHDFSDALAEMFYSFTSGMMDFMNKSNLIDTLNTSKYIPTFQDKDGDWFIIGEVPWSKFLGSCKRLLILRVAAVPDLCGNEEAETST